MTAQGDRTKDLLIDATISVVAKVGYHRATTRAIAKLAGVAEGTLYRHFPDKRSLFFAAVLASHQPVLAWMADLPGRAGTAPLAEVLTDCLTQLKQLRETVVPLELALAADPDFATPPADGLDLAALAAAGGPPLMLARYLAAEQARGRIRPELDTTQIAVVLLATLFGLALNTARAPGLVDDAMIAAAVSLLVNGIATPPAVEQPPDGGPSGTPAR